MTRQKLLPASANPRLKDVARLAGVSVMTASRVVNGKVDFVRPETRRRVEEAIEALNYRPNSIGRGLRLSQSLAIGMLILDPLPTFLSDSFTTQLVAGLSNVLNEKGYSLNLQGVTPRRIRNALLLRMVRADGLCVFSSGPVTFRKRMLTILEQSGQPTVLFQETLQPPSDAFCRVRQDDFSGGALLARHVLEKGARRLAFVIPSFEWPAIPERRRGIESVVDVTPGAQLEIVKCRSSHINDVSDALSRRLCARPRPDAVLAGNDHIGLAAMKVLGSFGISVPKAMMVAAFHGFEHRYYADPVLTTIRSPAYEIGARGGREMMRRLTHGSFSAHDIVLPIELNEGGST